MSQFALPFASTLSMPRLRTLLLLLLLPAHTLLAQQPWVRHTIDDSSQGADGVRPADVNGDGRLDLCVGWEEGGIVRVYLHPGPGQVTSPWPAVTVGKVKSPEDAVFVDVNDDGAIDVVSACEGKQRTIFMHLAPSDPSAYLDPQAWQTQPLTSSKQQAQWMFVLPWLGEEGEKLRLIAGSKGPDAAIGQFARPSEAPATSNFVWTKLADAGWIMSLIAEDVDSDGQKDLVYSDRKGSRRGVYWLNLTSRETGEARLIGGSDREVMFADVADIDGDNRRDVMAATRDGGLLVFRRTGEAPKFETIEIHLPERTGTGKSVKGADIDLDGSIDLVFSCENAQKKHGVMWLSRRPGQSLENSVWSSHPISGDQQGIKFDLLQLIDLDEDGDLDVLTCEERDNLGVIWYENPTR